MRQVTVLLLALGMFLAQAGPALADEDAKVFLEEDFDENRGSWSNLGGRNNLQTVEGFDGNGLKIDIPRGSHFGSEFYYGLEPNTEQLYFRYFMRFDENFNTHGSGGKIPGPAGIYSSRGLGCKPSTPSQPGWSARMQWFPVYESPESATSTRIGYYTYHLDQPKDCGEGMKWNEHAELKHGEWYCIEGFVKLNTPGENNGVLKGWVNNQEAFDRSDIAFRREGEENIDIRNFWFNIYFGGKRTPQEGQAITFDNVALSSKKVGCPAGMTTEFAEYVEQVIEQMLLARSSIE